MVVFSSGEKAALTSDDIPAEALMTQTLAYAREIERIV